MAVKAKNRKKNKIKELISNSIRIKCCYCDLKGQCKTQESKEKSENMGFTTYCTMTPNVPKKQKKRINKQQMA